MRRDASLTGSLSVTFPPCPRRKSAAAHAARTRFTSLQRRTGTPLTANNVIRAFRIITKKAGLGEDWVPREMRHTFVSVLSANGVPVESIALLAEHERSATTESVYRHEIRPMLTQGAELMDNIFG